MTNMIIYLIGTLLVVAGLAYGADRLGYQPRVDHRRRTGHHRHRPDGRHRQDAPEGSGPVEAAL